MVKKIKTEITNFKKNSVFFFHIENFLKYINKDKNKNYLRTNEKERQTLQKLIEKYKGIQNENIQEKAKVIKIKTNFFEEFKKFESIGKIKSEFGNKVEKIITLLNQESIKINLINTQTKYHEIYNKKYSLMTFSRILKSHLDLHFLKTTLKNAKLKKNLYKFMTYFFIKGIVRALTFDLKLLFIDETAFKLANNNYYCWRKRDEVVIGQAENNLKKQMNMIAAIDDQNIVHYKIVKDPINNIIFKEFINEMLEKIGTGNIPNYLIIMDNAKCHIAKSTKKYMIDKHLKVLTNVPYFSEFNAIEYLFLNIKSHLYKILIKNTKDLKKEIESFLNNEKIKARIKNIYLSGLKRYLKFINDNTNINIDDIYKNI